MPADCINRACWGQLIVGVLLGPTVLDMLHWGILQGVDLQHTIKELAELGVLLLMFNIGLEVHLSELAKVGKVAVFAGVLGVVAPVVFTLVVVLPAGYDLYPALFAGVTLAATSVSISAQVLLELGYLHTKEGNALLATALIDDVLAILAVSLTLVLAGAQSSGGNGDVGQLLAIVLQMAGYIAVAFALAWYALPPLFRYIRQKTAAFAVLRHTDFRAGGGIVLRLVGGVFWRRGSHHRRIHRRRRLEPAERARHEIRD